MPFHIMFMLLLKRSNEIKNIKIIRLHNKTDKIYTKIVKKKESNGHHLVIIHAHIPLRIDWHNNRKKYKMRESFKDNLHYFSFHFFVLAMCTPFMIILFLCQHTALDLLVHRHILVYFYFSSIYFHFCCFPFGFVYVLCCEQGKSQFLTKVSNSSLFTVNIYFSTLQY